MTIGKIARRGISLLIAVFMIAGMAGPSWAYLFAFVTTESVLGFSNGQLFSEQADLTVRISYTAEAEIPEEAVILADEIPEGCADYEAYFAAASKIVLESHPEKTIAAARFYDLRITDADGQKIEPKADVEVHLGAEGLDPEHDFSLVHFPEDAVMSDLLRTEPLRGAKRAADIPDSDTFGPDAVLSMSDAESLITAKDGAEEDDSAYPQNSDYSEEYLRDFEEETAAGDGPEAEIIPAEYLNGGLLFTTNGFSVFGIIETTIEKVVLASDGQNYRVSVTYTSETGIPEDAALEVEEIPVGSEPYDMYVQKSESTLGLEEGDHGAIRLFDIKIVSRYDSAVKYQPAEGTSVAVKIELADDMYDDISVIHFADEAAAGEEVENFTVNENAIEIAAEGFSVYAIVPGPMSLSSTDYKIVTSVDELTSVANGFYIGHTDGYYLKNTVAEVSGRTYIGRTAKKDVPNVSDGAVRYYFEEASDGKFYIYCFDSDSGKQYVRNVATNSLFLTADESQKTAFTVEVNDTGVFKIHNGSWYWNNTGNNGFAALKSSTNANNNLYIWRDREQDEDPYDLDGMTYGLMTWTGGRTAKAVMASVNNYTDETTGQPYQGCLEAKFLSVMTHENDGNKKLYVPNDTADSATQWTFVAQDLVSHIYTLQADNGKYLKITNNGLELSDTPDSIKVTAGTGVHKGQISMKSVSSGKTLTYSGKYAQGYNTSGVSGSEWLYLVTPMPEDILAEYEKVYTATKVGVSDTEKVTTGSQIIIYARQWKNNHYEYFAVNGKGELVPCNESGDTIEWYGGNLNDMLWQFTEYQNSDGTPNGYYELENVYARQNGDPSYLAPQLSGNQVLFDHTVGLLLQGRTNQQYYTPIVAWDNPKYMYSGLTVDLNQADPILEPCYRADGLDFYFAIMDEVPVDDEIHTVPTVDNTQYGIVVKMVDLTNGDKINTNAYGSGYFMNNFLGNKTSDGATLSPSSGILSPMLGPDGYPTVTGATAGTDWTPTHTGDSLANLYNNDANNFHEQTVNHLFMESTYRATGYYEYNSAQNYAHLLKEGDALVGQPSPDGGTYAVGDFVVYKELGTHDTSVKPSLQHGQFFPYNDIQAGRFASGNPENLYDVHKDPLPDSDPRKHEQLYLLTGSPDYYFAMEVEASFIQTPSGLDAWGHDIIFEFSGDDDFWLYVDDNLVIDLGGIHSAISGSVNFRTGAVDVAGMPTTLRALFEANYRATHENPSDSEVTTYLDNIFVPGGTVFQDDTNHTMRIFYMERGASASNLHMKFNLAAVKKGTVELTKKLEGASSTKTTYALFPYQVYYTWENDASNTDSIEHMLRNSFGAREVLLAEGKVTQEELDHDPPYYSEQDLTNLYLTTDYFALYGAPETTNYVFNKDSTLPVTFLPEIEVDGIKYYNVFMLEPDDKVVLNFPVAVDSTTQEEVTVGQYRIVECGIDPDVYTQVRANDKVLQGVQHANTTIRDYGIEMATTDDRPRVEYVNKVKTLNDLNIIKELYRRYRSDEAPVKLELDNGSNNGINPLQEEKFDYRLLLRTPYDSGYAYVSLFIYHVKDPEGYYCMWDADTGQFERVRGAGLLKHPEDYPYGTKDYDELTDDYTDALGTVVHGGKFFSSFETGLNGSISGIPAYYTVEVRDMIPGTKYLLVERPTETPDGYKFYQYQNDELDTEGNPLTHTDPYNPSEGIEGKIRSTSDDDSNVWVRNYKGYGIRLRKIWEDATSIQDRNAAYFAVYKVDSNGAPETLVDGSVRQLAYTADQTKQELYWWYLDLPIADTGLMDYRVFEVVLATNGDHVVDEDGVVTGYTEIEPITEGGGITLNGTLVGQNVSKPINYAVTYAEPEWSGDNVLKLEATNTPATLPLVRIVKTDWAGSSLADAKFTLKYGDELESSLFDPETKISDASGLVAQVYLQEDTTYTLTETQSPQGYVGLESSLQIGIEDRTPSGSGWKLNVSPAIPEGSPEYYTVSYNSSYTVITLTVKDHPYDLEMIKVDKSDPNIKLRGVVFNLYKQITINNTTGWDDDHPYKEGLVTNTDGVIPEIDKNLPAGIYQLREMTSPTNYLPLGVNINFTISDTGVFTLGPDNVDGVADVTTLTTSEPDTDGKITYTLLIKNTPYTLKFKKVDIANSTNSHLEGAVFDLYKEVESAYVLEYRGMKSNSDGLLEWGSQEDKTTEFTLAVGNYKLIETTAPSGYNIKTEPVMITVELHTSNGTVSYRVSYDENTTLSSSGSGILIDDNTHTITLLISNSSGVELPSTGGPGVGYVLACGALLTTSATALALREMKRRRRKEDA